MRSHYCVLLRSRDGMKTRGNEAIDHAANYFELNSVRLRTPYCLPIGTHVSIPMGIQ